MPYLNDPRQRVTLNLQPDAYAALATDALRAGYATPGTYAMALVLARGAAPKPIPDERSRERLERAAGKTQQLREELARQQAQHLAQQQAWAAQRQALTEQLGQAQRALAQRPPLWEVQQLIRQGIEQAVEAGIAARAVSIAAPASAPQTPAAAPARPRRPATGADAP